MECGGDSRELGSGSCSCTLVPQRESHVKERIICCKCKERPAQVLANQTEALCGSCLNASLLSKFKTAINTNELILPTDKVLLAFSGGPASRVALEFLLEIREKQQRDVSYCKDGRIKAFGLGVAYVEEVSVMSDRSFDPEIISEEMRRIVMNGKRKPDEFLIVPLENVYVEEELEQAGANVDLSGRCDKLYSLLQNVTDATGREDLLEHLKMQALQQVADVHGYTKLISGLCTSRIATKVIAATAKGCGFSLPAELQYFDARWKVPVVLPLRDCVVKELVLLCHLRRLKTLSIPTFSKLSMSQNSINSLSASFVSLLQEDNPSRERTIVRTAAKLKPFFFNHLSSNRILKSSWRSSSNLERSTGNLFCLDETSEPLCPVCSAPLHEKEVLSGLVPGNISESSSKEIQKVVSEKESFQSGSESFASCSSTSRFIRSCCHSCRYQVFGGTESSKIHSLLPQLIKRRAVINFKEKEMWMRSQISEFFIPSDASSDCDS